MSALWRVVFSLAIALALVPGRGCWSAIAADSPELPRLPALAVLRYPVPVRTAVEEALAAAEAKPNDASANGKLGMVLHASHLLEEAEVCYRRARLLDPSSFQWAYLLGLVQANQADCGHAAETLRESIRLEPGYLPAQLELGSCLFGSGQWREASRLYQSILEKHPGSAEAHYGLGRVLAVNQDARGAIASFRRACELFSDFAAAHYALGHAYEQLGQKQQSLAELEWFEKTKGRAPRPEDRLLDAVEALNAETLEHMKQAEELARAAKLEEAAAAYEQALASNPRLVAAHKRLIALYGSLGQSAKGEEHFRAAVALQPNAAESYFELGLLLASQEKFTEAGKIFRRTLELDSAYPGAHLNLGYMLEMEGKLPEALAQYRTAAERDAGDAVAQYNVGRLLIHQKNYVEGIEHLLKSLSTTDQTSKPGYLYALGAAYERLGDREHGLYYLRQARRDAAASGQAKLAESIDHDLQTLGVEHPPQ